MMPFKTAPSNCVFKFRAEAARSAEMAPPQRRRGAGPGALSASARAWRLRNCKALPAAGGLYRLESMDRTARCLLCDGEAKRITYPYGTRWNGREDRKSVV